MIKWAVEHPTIVNLLMIAVCVVGWLAADALPKEVFPESSLDMVWVRVIQRGAGPEEIESGLLRPIEEAVQGITGISRITSEASENIGTVRIEVARGVRTVRVLRDVKDQVEQISSWPTSAERPIVFEIIRKERVISLALSGDIPQATLQSLADRVRDDLLARPLLTQVEVQAVRGREISVEVREEALLRYGLTIVQISDILRKNNVDLSGGTLRTAHEDLLIRAYGRRYRAKELEDLVVRALPGGVLVRLRDIANIREILEDSPVRFYFRGQRAVVVNILRITGDDALKIAQSVHAYVQTAKAILPPGVSLSVYRDQSVDLRSRIQLLVSNGIQGFFLVMITLSLLMSLRLAFWVVAGLPVSMLGTFWLMWSLGITINMISLFGILLVVGILVDDAIVVGENIYSHVERGVPPMRAAVDGTLEVMPAVLASVTTTMVAFMPLFFMGGIVGKFIYVIPAVVIAALAFSLIESLLVLPPHLAHSLQHRESTVHKQNRIVAFFDGLLRYLNERWYGPCLDFGLRHRWPMIATAITTLLFSLGLVVGGTVRFIFFPNLDGDQVVCRLIMRPGTPAKKTEEIALSIENKALSLSTQLKKEYGQEVVLYAIRWIGKHNVQTPFFSPPSGEEVAEIQLELLPGQERKISSYEVLRRWRRLIGVVEGAEQATFESLGTPPLGRPFEMNLLAREDSELKVAASSVKERLRLYPGIELAEDDLTPGKREMRMALTPLARSLGVTLQEVASQIRFRFYGQEVMRIQRGRDEVKLFVRYPEASRRRIADLGQVFIATSSGARIPLLRLVRWEEVRGLTVIRRVSRQRMATVYAEIDDNKGNRQEILRDLIGSHLPSMQKRLPSVRVSFEGQRRQQEEVVNSMMLALPLALFGIFLILVMTFQSYLQAFVILTTIPFGIIGAIFGHVLLGMPLTILSFFGIVGVSGIVVNDSLVLMDALNRNLQQGMPLFEATWLAGQSRLRPILSTTLTTVAGLLPLIAERSQQAQFLIPMAISLAFGVLFATFVTLIFVPCFFLIINDIRRFFYWLRHGRWPLPHEVEPQYNKHSASLPS